MTERSEFYIINPEMDTTPLTRSYLETLSTHDLIMLADEHGIDIPEGLNRRFIIGELLEITLFSSSDRLMTSDGPILIEGEFTSVSEAFPDTYNETRITMLMRDPGWVFVYWDFHTNLYTAVTNNSHFEHFFIRINSLSDANPHEVSDFFDIAVGNSDRKWYVHLSNRDYAYRVDLYSKNSREKEQLLARSSILIHPVSGIGDSILCSPRRYPPLIELSGIVELRKNQFLNHRQSFD